MKRRFFTISLLATIILVFWPSYEKLEETYQDYMFTKPPEERQFELRTRTGELIIRIGPFRSNEFMPWHRVQFGVPFGAITTDTQIQYRIFQMRFEGEAFLANIFTSIPVSLVSGSLGVMLTRLMRRISKQGEQAVTPNA